MAVTLTAPFPIFREQTNVGTTWTEFVLPARCRQVSVLTSAAAWVACSGTDGGAVSSTVRWPIPAANGSVGIPLAEGFQGSVFVAAQAATCTVWVSASDADSP